MSDAKRKIENFLDILATPGSLQSLKFDDQKMALIGESNQFPVVEEDIPVFANHLISKDAEIQREHFDKVSAKYTENLSYAHTRAYCEYLDEAVFTAIETIELGDVAEICCGTGEAFELLNGKKFRGVGVDISLNMLKNAKIAQADHKDLLFVQADATSLPLKSGSFDTVFMLGGIHHVNDRDSLFSEVSRILKPNGHFIFREPLNDFMVWQSIRSVIYRLSPSLDHETECPLRKHETIPVLEKNDFDVVAWTPLGFLGFCLFMNSDILIFNRAFRYIPGISKITRLSTKFDAMALKAPFLQNAGLQVVGVARKKSN